MLTAPSRQARRRALAALTVAGVSVTALAAGASTASARTETTITLAATTDVHGNVYDWDYFRNAPYGTDRAGGGVGLAKVKTVVDDVREARPDGSVLVVDNGDAIQGTPLTYYYAKQEPVTETGVEHPMATAFDAIGYDAQVVGNHEYNYGLDLLSAYEEDLEAPLLGANVVRAGTDEPYHQPYSLHRMKVAGAKPVTVGVLGLTTPGSAIWDSSNVAGKLEFRDMVASAQQWVPRVKAAGADVVVVLSHSGTGGSSSYDPAVAPPENVSDVIATQVPGVDVVVVGHSHRDAPLTEVTGADGSPVLLTQPYRWGGSVTVTDIRLKKVRGQWQVAGWHVEGVKTGAVEADPEMLRLLRVPHEETVAYVNQVVATSTQALETRDSRFVDTPILDFIHAVQTQVVTDALAGGEYEDLPVVSAAAPFSRTAVFPEGPVTIRDIASLYVFDNTLRGVVVTGAELRDYLERSARYYGAVPPADPDAAQAYNGTEPDYNLDQLSGVEYELDLSQEAGSRVASLTLGGEPVADTDRFVLALNNYRQGGGGGFPHVVDGPLVYDQQVEIRQALIDWASERGTIDPADFAETNWWLTDGSGRLYE